MDGYCVFYSYVPHLLSLGTLFNVFNEMQGRGGECLMGYRDGGEGLMECRDGGEGLMQCRKVTGTVNGLVHICGTGQIVYSLLLIC